MTKAEALAVCRDLASLVSEGPAGDRDKALRAHELLEGLVGIQVLGPLARTQINAMKVKFYVHFSGSGMPDIPESAQRFKLTSDIRVLESRIEDELEPEGNYGPKRP
jgi:hypothetical protein